LKPVEHDNKVGLSGPPKLPPRSTRPGYVALATPKQEETFAPSSGTPNISREASTLSKREAILVNPFPLGPPGIPPCSTRPDYVPLATPKRDVIAPPHRTAYANRLTPHYTADDVEASLDRSFAGLSVHDDHSVPSRALGSSFPHLRPAHSVPALNTSATMPVHAPEAQTVGHEPVSPSPSAPGTPNVSSRKKKFYTVVAGKRTGVFTDW
jgi:hypothetical protein